MKNDERKIVTDIISVDTGPFHMIRGNFEAERYSGQPLLDTTVTLDIPPFCITWENRTKLMNEIALVIFKHSL